MAQRGLRGSLEKMSVARQAGAVDREPPVEHNLLGSHILSCFRFGSIEPSYFSEDS